MADEFDLLRAQKRVFRSSLRSLERLVVLAILDHWSAGSRKPFPSLATLQDCTGLGKRAVIDAIKGLSAAGAVRVECRRPMRWVNGRHEVVPNAKPTNHYDLSGLMTLPVRVGHQCASDTSALDAPVRERTPTSAPDAPELVREGIPKEPRNKPKKEPSIGAPSRSLSRSSKKSTSKGSRPETEMPTDWQPTEAHREFATKHGLDVELEATGFRGHFDGKRVVSWNGRFTTWLANQAKWKRERGPRKANGRLSPPQSGLAHTYVEGTI